MAGLLLLFASVAPSAAVRLAVEAAPSEVLVVNPGPAAAVFSVRPAGCAPGWFLPVEPGSWRGIPVPPGLDKGGIVFDCATEEGISLSGIPLFAEGEGRLRRSVI